MKQIRRPILIVYCFASFLILILLTEQILGAESDQKLFRSAFTADIISGVDQNDAKVALEIMTENAVGSAVSGMQSEIKIFPDVQTAVKEYRTGNIDILSISSINYLKMRDQVDIEPTFISLSGGKAEQKYALLVNKDSGYNTLNQLKNKTLKTAGGNTGDIGLLWLDTILYEHSLPGSSRFFKTIKRVNKSSRAVLPVFFNQADCCVVLSQAFNTMVELNPQVGKKLSILFESKPLLLSVSCLNSGVDEELKQAIKNWYNSIADQPSGKQFCLMFRFDKVITFQPDYLINIEQLHKKYKRLKQE